MRIEIHIENQKWEKRIRSGVFLAISSRFLFSLVGFELDRSIIDYLEIIKIALSSCMLYLYFKIAWDIEILMRYRVERAIAIDNATSIVSSEIFPSTNCFRYKCG